MPQQNNSSPHRLLTLLLIIGGALVVLAFYLGFVLLNNSTAQRDAVEATTVALIATQISTLQPTPPLPTPFATVTPSPVPLPSSCAMLKEQQPTAEDGPHTIYLTGQTAITLQCHNMDTAPADYLTLPSTASGNNFSLISYPEGAIVTHYEKVRINPSTLIIDPSDMTFAKLGEPLAGYSIIPVDQLNSYAVAASDFGVGMGCNRGEADAPLGRANIDLSNTPFVVDPDITFTVFGGDVQEVSNIVSEDGKIVNVAVNGRCGIIQPASPIQLVYQQP
ncbi:hypothetical protein MNBD_CHLOROFLEXI01-477 [hydrothermal vent metagenome]|uniref:GON domain-containing protein n=1 Tax=hydrothermal vent metagenome TaxID=652676 RepID=A0A3B0V5L5_9ZZZZ